MKLFLITSHNPNYLRVEYQLYWPCDSEGELDRLVEGGQLDQVGKEDQPGGAHHHHQVEGEDQGQAWLHPVKGMKVNTS